MKLMRLILKDFKGIKALEIEPGGSDVSIYGTNGTGKTTIFDAVTWLLFGRGSTDAPDFNPKTVDVSGEEIHGLFNIVEGTFSLEDGSFITLRKEYHEIWTKKRGNAEHEYAGNTTDYYIDGVPVKKGEYDGRIADICPAEYVKILTSPLYFSEVLSWQERRRILLDVCGDITDEEVICSSTELSDLIGYLQKPGGEGMYTVEEYRKIADARHKEINRRLQELPARIDEVVRSMPEVDGIDEGEVKSNIAELQKALDAALAEKAAINEQSATTELRGQIGALKVKYSEKKMEYQQNIEDLTEADRDDMASIRCRKREVDDNVAALEGTIEALNRRLAGMKNLRELLSSEYEELKKQEWDGNKVCPTCKQELPGIEIAHIITTFNVNKSRQLEDIRHRIKRECSKEKIAELEKQIEEREKELSVLRADAALLTKKLAEISGKVKAATLVSFEKTTEAAEISVAIAALEEKLFDFSKDLTAVLMDAQLKIDTIRAKINSENGRLQLLQTSARQKERLSELEAEEKALNEEYEDVFHGIYLCEAFIKAKTSMLDSRINAMFDGVRFKLFDTQINGGLKEICEVLVPTETGVYVPYSKTNAAARMNAGLSIIDTLSRHFGVSMPVFVDNAESVVALQKIRPQVIRLVVSENDARLRVEVDV